MLTVKTLFSARVPFKMYFLLNVLGERIHFHREIKRNSHQRQRDRIREGIIAPLISNTIRTPQCRHYLGNFGSSALAAAMF